MGRGGANREGRMGGRGRGGRSDGPPMYDRQGNGNMGGSGGGMSRMGGGGGPGMGRRMQDDMMGKYHVTD